MERRESASAQALSEARAALGTLALTHGPQQATLEQALARFPAAPSSNPAPVQERQKALAARRAAIAARAAAIAAEERALVLREAAVDEATAAASELHQLAEEIRSQLEAQARATRALAQEKARAEEECLRQQRQSEQAARPGMERRRQPRVAMQTEVSLSSESNFYSGFSSEVSEGGIFIATCNVLDRGTEIDLEFSLPTSPVTRTTTTVTARGVVRWSRVFNDKTPEVFPGIGVEFLEIPPEHQQAIHAFTREREPLFWTD
ncbi:MAG: PilZ domain-containing protein [Myxococcales bacterium]